MIQQKLEKYDKQKCTGCHACKVSCPVDCISMKTDKEGFWYPEVSDKCIDCSKCIKACHIFNDNSTQNNPVAYACINKDEEVRMKSSSGGVFYELAKQTIAKGGVVFGAALNEDLELEHSYAEDLDGIKKYQGSKYLQSRIGNCYKETKIFLKSGRLVLFSATPCQIGGLKAFLGKEYSTLFCVDIICHGVPSPMVWQKYVKYQQACYSAKINKISFRDKEKGWKNYHMQYEFRDGLSYVASHREDSYMQSFLKDLCLRPSCYDCDFKTINRQSDITLADFWGVQHIMPEMDDDKGTSLIFVNSHVGNDLLGEISTSLKIKEVDLDVAIANNPSAIKSVAKPKKREEFLQKISRGDDFAKIALKYTHVSVFVKIKKMVRRMLSKVYRLVLRKKEI